MIYELFTISKNSALTLELKRIAPGLFFLNLINHYEESLNKTICLTDDNIRQMYNSIFRPDNYNKATEG